VIRGLSARGALRALTLLAAALLAVTAGSRVPFPTPDLVLVVVAAAALLAGPSRGGLIGLAAGWLVDLMPPGAAVLGTSALLYAAAGLVAGAGRREGETPPAWIGLVVALSAVVAGAGRVGVAVLSGAPVAWADLAARAGLTALLGVVAVPLLVRAEHALVRRRPA
jgi:rod shape-determining protein MreD